MDSNPVSPPLSSQKIKCLFLDYIQLLMIGWAGQWTRTPSATPLESKKLKAKLREMLVMIGRAGRWTLTPSATPLQSKKWNGLRSTSDDRPGWLMDSNPIHHPSPAKKIKLDYIQLLIISLVDGLKPHPPPLLQPKKYKMLIFGLCSTSDDQPGWSMDSNPIRHPSPALVFGLCSKKWNAPAKKIKCSFSDYVQLLMIGQAGWWTRTPSATPLQPKI